MTPFQKWCEHWAANYAEVDFGDYIAWHLRHGVVVSNDRVFLLAYEANSCEIKVGWLPPAPVGREPNTWVISALAGSMTEAWKHEPRIHPFFAFLRVKAGKQRLALYPRTRLRELTALKHCPIATHATPS